jgi:hypothetical protein
VDECKVRLQRQFAADATINGKNCAVIPWRWYGDPETGFNEFLYEFNKHLKRSGCEGLYYFT